FIQGVPSSIQCPRNLSEDSASSDSSGSSSQLSEQGKTALPESTDTIALEDSRDAAITSGTSTSPVNISSEDSQMSKSAPPHPYYHQPIPKTQLPSDHLNSNPHQFHSDAQRNHPYAPDRAKDDMMSYLQNSTHPKGNMDGNKGYMDSFGVEHHQPPPPYSAHQLLASSLAAANLDQLDVLLTCKQCDQNFNNLASFLGHKQYCAQHTFAQNELKDISKMEDSRKFHTEPAKAVSSVSNVLMSRCPSDLHLSLLGLNKNGELISDSETKGDSKDDPMKLNLFSGPGHLPVTLPELEMDAKLDSLITEALNGLGYQSDNAEIDSSFIDAFVDDDLTTVKATSNKQCLKTKESLVFESKNKQAAEDDRSSSQGKYFYDSDVENPETDKQYTESRLEKISLNLEQDERINIKKEVSHMNSRIASREKTREQDNTLKEARKLCKSEDENTGTQRFLLSNKFSERCGVKSFQESSALRGSTPSQASTSPTSRTAVKESKRKNSGGGTWSKELIHKIVQQKNKLHKLHVKGTKNLQFSLVMERLTPTVQNPAFGEYDYVSDTDDECEPVKIASQGRLNQSSRCKYTYTKECKWRARSERDQAAWRHESKECFEVKKSEEVSLSPVKHASHQRLRRRGSRSSTSSEVSTSVSVSSDGISSPKSIDRTDSDCEKKTDVKKKEFPEQQTYERSSPQKLCKDSSTLALTFSKPVKKYNTDKAILSDSTDDPKNQSNPEVDEQVSSSQRSKDTIKNFEKSRSSHTKREKLMSPRKETGKTVNPVKYAQQREDNPCTKEEPTHVLSLHCSSTDSTPLQFDSHSNTINKEPDFNIDTHTKGTEGEGPQATQPELSDSTTFEKQSDSVCMVKEAIHLVNDLDAHKPASLCTSLMDEVCLSPTKRQGPLIQKDMLHLMHYPLDQDQGLLKSPLSFDTSSMFGDLTGFDSGLYSDMPIQKDGFHSMENTTDKKEEFVSSFSPFLEQRDWNLIVSPVLPDEISQYKSSSEKPNEKKTDYNHVSLSLPDKIIDYSESLHRCASEDELEIKRIVNELENQLQTTKLENPTLLAQDVTKQLKMSKFSPLRLSDETESGGLDIKCSVQTMNVAVSSLPSEPFTEPWSSPFHFDLMGEHHSPHTPMHNEPGALEHLTENVDDSFITTASHIEHRQLHHDQESVKRDAEKETPTETKEEILEQKRYTENLMKSLEVISDSIFKKEPIISEHKEPNLTSLTSQQRQEIECQATDAVEREDHSEKEAITGKENILSPPNINERKDDIEFILNESLSSLSNSTDPTVDGKQPVSLKPSKPTENNESKAGTKVTSEEDITENSHLIESAPCSSVVTHDPHVVEESDRDSNAAYDVNHLFENSGNSPEHLTTNGYEEAEAVKGITDQSFSQPSSPALPDFGVECSDSVNEEITAEQDPLIGLSPCENRSPAKTYSASPTTALSMEIVTTDEPCSPILVEPNTESTSHCSPFRDTASMKGQITSPAEPAEVSDCLEKSDSMCDFKLSPLNYNSISDEPPQLNQYDYISPASEHSENADIKQSPRDDCGACDLSVNPALIFNKTEVEAVVSLNSDPAAKIILSDESLVLQQNNEPRNTPCCAVEEVCEQKASEDSLAQEILRKVVASDEAHPLSCLSCSPVSPPGISPDLKALLDDDTTFSQLFPRDDEAKRKKCPRVYSKRNKRQKLSPDTNVTQESPPLETLMQSKDQFTENKAEEIFTESQTNRCEYETISIDDAIMLNMCHNSTLKTDVKEVSDAKQSDQQDVLEDVKEVCNSPLNPLESTVDKSSIEWSGSSGLDAGSTVTSDTSSCKAEEPTPPSPSPPPSAPHTVDPCVTKSIQTFQSIDIQNINTTFQLPEIKFFDPKKDISVAPPIAAVDVENRDDEKSKKVMERRGRKRKDGGIKVKDKQYKCKVCFTWFLTLGELNFHKLSHNPSPPPTCYMCVQRKFSSREQLRDHLREKHAKNKTGIWTCGMCLKEISDVWMYNEHLREHATQFARRGQTQGSMLGIPGCFMQETAVKNFITSIMQHRPSKASRESSKAAKEQEKAVAADSAVGEGKSSEGAEPKVHKTKSSSGAGGKQSTLTPLEVLHKTETPKSVEMHPNCKDPSRDCHHCGKQFPKPFKLQRHLVVHNLEKIFLCHKCPVSYQEAQELKGHLKREHEEVDELDSKHTTLYTCELCADVMHVIKKSFICSTCNYTFSKKEQFDRHMEKHLSGGNKIFKFRGVLRPVKASAPKEDECDSPASKKRRILSDSLQENSSDSGIASVSSLHLNQNSESSKPSVSTSDDSTQTITNEYHSDTNNTNVKTEDVAEDYSDLLVELEKCIHMGSSESDATKKEELDPATSPLSDKDTNGKSMSDPCDVKEENESVCIRAETTSWSASKESSSAGEDTVKAEDSSAEGDTTETGKETDSLPLSKDSFVSLKENPIISKTLEAKRESAAVVMDQQSEDEQCYPCQKASNNDSKQLTLSQGAEPEGSSPMKDKVSPAKTTENTKNRTGSMKATDSTPVINSKVEDKDPLRQQKKRKDIKSPHSLQRVSSPATQENFGVDSRAKKKIRPSKCANQSLQRKADGPNDYPVLSSVRDDVVSNKIVSKCKTSNLGLQSKRNLLDGCTQKKAEIATPLNGDYKAKKGPLGRPLHPPISKV
ncbi:Zinc finger protein 469, partial [Dissostichus eleginoides]